MRHILPGGCQTVKEEKISHDSCGTQTEYLISNHLYSGNSQNAIGCGLGGVYDNHQLDCHEKSAVECRGIGRPFFIEGFNILSGFQTL